MAMVRAELAMPVVVVVGVGPGVGVGQNQGTAVRGRILGPDPGGMAVRGRILGPDPVWLLETAVSPMSGMSEPL